MHIGLMLIENQNAFLKQCTQVPVEIILFGGKISYLFWLDGVAVRHIAAESLSLSPKHASYPLLSSKMKLDSRNQSNWNVCDHS